MAMQPSSSYLEQCRLRPEQFLRSRQYSSQHINWDKLGKFVWRLRGCAQEPVGKRFHPWRRHFVRQSQGTSLLHAFSRYVINIHNSTIVLLRLWALDPHC